VLMLQKKVDQGNVDMAMDPLTILGEDIRWDFSQPTGCTSNDDSLTREIRDVLEFKSVATPKERHDLMTMDVNGLRWRARFRVQDGERLVSRCDVTKVFSFDFFVQNVFLLIDDKLADMRINVIPRG
jgi:hypothetical protein